MKKERKIATSFRVDPKVVSQIDDLMGRFNQYLYDNHWPEYESRAAFIRFLLDAGLKQLKAR